MQHNINNEVQMAGENWMHYENALKKIIQSLNSDGTVAYGILISHFNGCKERFVVTKGAHCYQNKCQICNRLQKEVEKNIL